MGEKYLKTAECLQSMPKTLGLIPRTTKPNKPVRYHMNQCIILSWYITQVMQFQLWERIPEDLVTTENILQLKQQISV